MGTLNTSLLDAHAQPSRLARRDSSIRTELHRMLVDLACDFALPGTSVYELGCADSVFPRLHQCLPDSIGFVGIDEPAERLERARRSLACTNHQRRVEFVRTDLNQGVVLREASVVLMVASLRQLRFQKRAPLMADIFRGLRERGCLIIVEQVLGRDSLLNNVFATHGTCAVERNVVDELTRRDERWLPYPLAEEHGLLSSTGFRSTEVFFKWYGLCGLIAVK